MRHVEDHVDMGFEVRMYANIHFLSMPASLIRETVMSDSASRSGHYDMSVNCQLMIVVIFSVICAKKSSDEQG